MTQLGIDYGSVDENAAPSFTAAFAAGARFAIIRKSFVLYDRGHAAWHLAPDSHFARDAAAARAAGLTVGAYAFFAFAKGAPSAAEQVASLLNAPGDVIAGRDLPYCIDVELTGRGIVDTGRTQAEAFAFALELVREVRRKTGTAPLVYTSHGQWHDTDGLGGPDSHELDGCQLWQKTAYRLAAGLPVDQVAPRVPHIAADATDPHDYWRVPTPWQRQGCWIQQYQGDAVGFPGFNKTVDVNRFFPLSAVGADVPRTTWLQRQLLRLGYSYPGILDTQGVWGIATCQALHAFQLARGLSVTGSVDIATFAALCW